MDNQNVCMFIPTKTHSDVHIVHFVYETKKQVFDGFKSLSIFRLYAVLEGSGTLITQSGKYSLSKGDVFITLPTVPFAIDSGEVFHYAYIGFIGELANELIYKNKISHSNCVFRGLEGVEYIWQNMISLPSESSELSSKSTFFYTFAQISALNTSENNRKKEPHTASVIKKYIDENFTDSELSLSSMCKSLSYNPKYISAVFKNEFKISFKEYLNTIRIQNACALFEKGFTGVKDVALLCGFNDPLYFSKVFKQKMKNTPTEHVSEINTQKN